MEAPFNTRDNQVSGHDAKPMRKAENEVKAKTQEAQLEEIMCLLGAGSQNNALQVAVATATTIYSLNKFKRLALNRRNQKEPSQIWTLS